MWSHPSVHLGAVGPLRRFQWSLLLMRGHIRIVKAQLNWSTCSRQRRAISRIWNPRSRQTWHRVMAAGKSSPSGYLFKPEDCDAALLNIRSRKSHSIRSHLGRTLQTLEPSTTAYEFRAATAICKCSNQIIYSRRAYIILQEKL